MAFLAGALSISSPCCISLIPGYLSYVSGVAIGELSGQRRGVLGAAALFVAGFALIFTALGASVSLIGSFLRGVLPAPVDIAGVFVILMGLSMLGVVRVPFLQRGAATDQIGSCRAPASRDGVCRWMEMTVTSRLTAARDGGVL